MPAKYVVKVRTRDGLIRYVSADGLTGDVQDASTWQDKNDAEKEYLKACLRPDARVVMVDKIP